MKAELLARLKVNHGLLSRAPAVIAALALGIAAVPASADPSPPIRRLMNEPVNMLDWGMQRMLSFLRDTFPTTAPVGPITGGLADINVNYDNGKNEIKVYVLFDDRALYSASAKQACAGALQVVRGALFYKLPNGSYLALWTQGFMHSGFTDPMEDAKLHDELPKLVRVHVHVSGVGCFGPLMTDSVNYDEIGR